MINLDIEVIAQKFAPLADKYKLKFSSGNIAGWMRTTVNVESDVYAIAFESDNMSLQSWCTLKKKSHGKVPSHGSSSNIVNIMYVAELLAWSEYPDDQDDELGWVVKNIKDDPDKLFNLDNKDFVSAIKKQRKDSENLRGHP